VYLFTDAVKDNATGERAAVIRQNLVTCLRGSALEWYTSELDDLHRAGLKFSQDGVKQWTKALIQRFKDPPSTALRKLQLETYTMDDTRNGKNIRSYITSVVRHAKAAEFEKPVQQLSQAWNNLAPELRVHIERPTENTTLRQFMDAVSSKQDSWSEMYQKNDRPRALPRPNRRLAGNSQFSYRDRNNRNRDRDRRPVRPFYPNMNFQPYYPFSNLRTPFQQSQQQPLGTSQNSANTMQKNDQKALPPFRPHL
jgi:hypothetical protein